MTQEEWTGLVVIFNAAIEVDSMYTTNKTAILGILAGEMFSACAETVNALARKGVGENEIREFMRGYGFKAHQIAMLVGE